MGKTFSSLFTWPDEMDEIEQDETAELEQLLRGQLAPVKPRQDYIHDLGKRLADKVEPVMAQERQRADQIDLWQGLLLIAAGVISGILMVLFGVRMVRSVAAARQAR